MTVPNNHPLSHDQATAFVRQFPWRACAFTTFTGVDEATNLDELAALSEKNSGRVEWGILLGSQERFTGRYPSRAKIEELASLRLENEHVKVALHLCGRFALRWVDEDEEIVRLASQFDRIQLNVNGYDSRLDQAALKQALLEGRHPAVITQFNHKNIELTEFLGDAPNHALLFDASGGRGIMPEDWPLPIDGKVCGYAGGLGPGLIDTQLRKIASLANGPFWIDMENSLRNADDEFDLLVCAQVLQEVEQWRASLAQEVSRYMTKPLETQK